MYYLFFIFAILLLSTVDGQQCRARFNQTISGQCSSIDNCRGTILTTNSCQQQRCCIPTTSQSTPAECISANDFDALYNTSRANFLRTILNNGINLAGICRNCQAKAAFLAVAATMTENFQTDEATKNDVQLASDDNKYGNSQPGDGSRFRRRGFFGLRGKAMYQNLQASMPQYQSLSNPESVALTQNAIIIAAKLWINPDLMSEPALTRYADGSFYGFSMLWYKLNGDIEQLSIGAKYYSKFLRQLQCGGDLYPGQGPTCHYNTTHQGTCSADCIKGLEDSSTYCGCSSPRGQKCPNSPAHIRCCLDTCSQELKMDLGFVLDASGSVGRSNYQLQLKFTQDLLRRVNVGLNKTHVGIINYSDDVQTLTWLNTDYTLEEKLRRVNQSVYYASGTNTARALRQVDTVFSYQRGRRQSKEGVTPVIFVITDGKSDNQSATIGAANVLKQKGIILVSVGVGNGPNLGELHAVCSPPASENYFAMSDYTALEQKLNQFTSKSCSEPASVSSNITVTIEIIKDKYKFLKVEIVTIGNKILITVTLFNGNVKLFYSFTNRNPKDPAEFIDYETRSDLDLSRWTQVKSYFQRSSTKTSTAKNGQVTLIVDKPDNNVDFVYIGIKGIEENNKFEIKFDDCAEVNCKTSNTSTMKLSIVLVIFLWFVCTLNKS
ncbi:unnamed protein product [Rotaria sp. Silwood2]|nr:unnamed protein product [Rotaria sp. Silwood2]CAF2583449.1 unnamed protein product [Rotaria sp. Silwood2]CAF3867354.1 unnamed protein product [Rotaria sp. Silwood2]CAF3981917.1 unnamed protein product [Rotaria sp. Silwood2]